MFQTNDSNQRPPMATGATMSSQLMLNVGGLSRVMVPWTSGCFMLGPVMNFKSTNRMNRTHSASFHR